MGDTLIGSPGTGCGGTPGASGGGGVGGGTNDKALMPMNQFPSRMDTPLMHPLTPLDGQGSLPRTPMNGHSGGHPHTPLDGHGNYADGLPGTPLDGQQGGGVKLRHVAPSTPASSSAGNPHTPSNASAVSCGSVGPPAMHGSFDSPIMVGGSHGGGGGDAKASLSLSGGECLAHSVKDDQDFSLGFEPVSMMDSNGQTQQVLDVSMPNCTALCRDGMTA